MSAKIVFTLFLIANILIVGCQGGAAGCAAGFLVCNAGCHSGYIACITAGGSLAVYVTGGLACPGVVWACSAGEVACLATCVTVFCVATGPV